MDVENKIEETSTGEDDSLRGALESAFEASEDPTDATADTARSSSESEASASADRVRTPDGRFAKKEAEAESHGATDSQAGERVATVRAPTAVATTPVDPYAKPPQSWKPANREAWATLPLNVREEILRREGQTSAALNETSEARKFREDFGRVVAPYEQMLRSENSEPMRAVQNLLETARELRQAPPIRKAQLVAQIVQSYGVPIEALDSALAGQPIRSPAQVLDPRVDQLFADIERAKSERARNEAAAADNEVSEFGASHEFFPDVREDMADIIEMAERRGQKIDLESAYKRAVAMNEEISGIMRQREAAKSSPTARAATARARAASSSVRTVGPPAKSGPESTNLRDALESAWESSTS